MNWTIHHRPSTASTNLDARAGRHGDVFTADFQTAGRGRLDHKWLSAPGENLMLSAVLDVGNMPPDRVATLPLVVGLAVIEGLSPFLSKGLFPRLKWPNDVLVEGRKLAGILCERHGDTVIVGLGVNVKQRKFAPEIEKRATSLALLIESAPPSSAHSPFSILPSSFLNQVRDAILAALGRLYATWHGEGLSPFLGRLAELDFLRGRTISVRQTDDDAEPIRGVCQGIAADGSLLVGGQSIYAGEAHIDNSQWQG